ncbi:MAG: ABC transporter permease [Oscillospiraceae bacterium]|nr:ABC transporter permease [Oscillospiraceae bacterium]
MMKLNRRYRRNLRQNLSFYLVVSVLTALVGMLLISGVSTGLKMKDIFGSAIRRGNSEDAQLITMLPITDDEADMISERFDLDFERLNYYEQDISQDCTLRLLGATQKVDLHELEKGEDITRDDQILMSELFARNHDYSIGDKVKIGGREFTVTGFMVRSDYISMFKEVSDSFANYKAFGIAVAGKDAVDEISGSKSYYAVKYSSDNSVEFRRYINDKYRILSYTPSASNGRINASLSESKLILTVAAVAAPVVYIIVVLLIMLMLSRKLKAEQRQIGTLTALGYRSGEISRHYLLYSLIPGCIGGVLSLIAGYAMTFPFCDFYFGYYEQLGYSVSIDPVIAAAAVLLPPVLYSLIAHLSVKKMTSKNTIDLLKGIQKETKHKKKSFASKKLAFRTKYKLRSVTEHKARSFVVVAGIVVSTICVLLGWSIKDSVDTLVQKSIDQTPFEYSYLMNTTDFKVPDSAECILINQYETKSSTLVFSMWGYEKDTEHITMKTLEDDPMEYGKYYMTNAAAKAYSINSGDSFRFRDPITTDEYEIVISGLINDNTSAAVYTSAENVAGFMDYEPDMRNTVISNEKLSLEADSIIKTISKTDLKKSIEAVVNMYYAVCYIITVIGFLIGVLSMYLISGMIIEENTVNISLLKILGYRKKEITGLVLSSNTIMVIVGIIIGVPVTIAVSAAVFASSVADIGVYFPMTIKPLSFMITFAVIILSYIVSTALAGKKVGRIEMTESLKNNNE